MENSVEGCEDIIEVLDRLTTNREIETYIAEHCKGDNSMHFHDFLNDALTGKNVELSDVVLRSRINKNYVYNIINGTRLNPSRDKVIALCIGAGLTLNETISGLEIAGYSRLRSSDERDLRIALAIRNGVCDALTVNLMLEENDLDLLDV